MPLPQSDGPSEPDLLLAVETSLGGNVEQWQRLEGGRTNRLWRVSSGGATRVVKVYLEGTGTELFPNDPQAEFTAISELAQLGLAPRPVARLSGTFGTALIYEYLEGPTWQGNVTSLSRLMHRVHTAPPASGLPRRPCGSEVLARQAGALLDRCGQAERQAIIDRLAALTQNPAVPEASVPCLIHGDPVATNVIETAEGLTLIDWQCAAVGDPCHDLSICLSPFMQRSYLGYRLGPHVAREFLDAYPNRDTVVRYNRLAPFFHLRMAAYALWCRENGRDVEDDDIASEIAGAYA